MPSSTWVHTSTVQDLLWKYQPKNILDIGVGFGRWGFLAREQLDIFRGRYNPKDWKTHITGVEAWSPYVQRHHKDIYNNIFVGTIQDFFKSPRYRDMSWDVIIAGDVIEHLPKQEALQIIEQLKWATRKAVIVCIPLGNGYPQGTTLGNHFEKHLSTWEESDFKDATRVTVVRERIKRRPYAVVLWEAPKTAEVVFDEYPK